jgi:hypothetical protein
MKLLTIVFLCLGFLVSSCKKEVVLTEAEKTAQKIQDIVSSRNIQSATAYAGNSRIIADQPFSIDGGYLVFAGNVSPSVYLNFSKLNTFEVGYGAGSKPFIVFYFGN